jgi:O-antigen ligase
MAVAGLCLTLLVLWTLLAYQVLPLPLEEPLFAWLRRQWLMEGVAGLTLLGVISITCAQWRRRLLRPNARWWPAWWLWMGWAAISCVYTIDRGASSRSVLALLSYGLLAYLASALVHSTRDVVVWARLLAAVAVIAALKGLFQYTRTFDETLPLLEHLHHSGLPNLQGWGGEVLRDFLVRKRLTSFFGWPNLFAGFLLLTMPLAAGLSAHATGRIGRLGWAAAGFLLGLCFLLTLSMGGWIAAILTGSFAWWLLIKPKREAASRSAPRLATFITLGVTLILVVCVTSFIVAKRARSVILSSLGSRVVYVQGAVNIMRAHPLIGTGTGTFGLAYRSLMPQEESEGEHSAQHAHNTLLEVGAELGLVGLGCFLAFLWQVGRLMAATLQERSADRTSMVRRGLVIGLVGFFLHSLLEQTFVESVTAPFWWIALGVLSGAALRDHAAGQPTLGRSHGVAGSLLPLVTACLGLLLLTRITAADLWAARGAFADLAGRPEEADQAFANAQRWDPLASRYSLERGERLLKQLRVQPQRRRQLVEQAAQQFERAALLSPWLGYAWLRLGVTRWQLGQADAAIAAMRQAVRKDPNSRAAAELLARMVAAAR